MKIYIHTRYIIICAMEIRAQACEPLLSSSLSLHFDFHIMQVEAQHIDIRVSYFLVNDVPHPHSYITIIGKHY